MAESHLTLHNPLPIGVFPSYLKQTLDKWFVHKSEPGAFARHCLHAVSNMRIWLASQTNNFNANKIKKRKWRLGLQIYMLFLDSKSLGMLTVVPETVMKCRSPSVNVTHTRRRQQEPRPQWASYIWKRQWTRFSFSYFSTYSTKLFPSKWA